MKLKEIFGEDLMTSCFSFEGTINRLGFVGFLWLVAFVNGLFFDFNIGLMILSVFIFYATLVVIQKRCRDFNYNGTIFILIYSVYYLQYVCWLYMKPYKEQVKEIFTANKCIGYTFAAIFCTYVLSLLLLLFIPGKKEKNLSLRSPLLKNPRKYIAICFTVCAVCLSVLIYWHRNYYGI